METRVAAAIPAAMRSLGARTGCGPVMASTAPVRDRRRKVERCWNRAAEPWTEQHSIFGGATGQARCRGNQGECEQHPGALTQQQRQGQEDGQAPFMDERPERLIQRQLVIGTDQADVADDVAQGWRLAPSGETVVLQDIRCRRVEDQPVQPGREKHRRGDRQAKADRSLQGEGSEPGRAGTQEATHQHIATEHEEEQHRLTAEEEGPQWCVCGQDVKQRMLLEPIRRFSRTDCMQRVEN